jgi:hypothetical protein
MYISAYHHIRSQLRESNKELVIDNSIETPVLTGPGRIRTYDLAFTSGQSVAGEEPDSPRSNCFG